MNTYKKYISLSLLGGCCLMCLSFSQAALVPLSYQTSVDTFNDNVTFTISFSEVPDFMTVDTEDRQASAFQFWIDPDGGAEPIWDASAIIRGSEIYAGGVIPVRDRLGDGGAISDGWGPVRDSVSYSLVGTNVSFVVPYAALGEDDGDFTYHFMVSEYGQAQFDGIGESGLSYEPVYTPPVVPEPSVLSLLAIALGLVFVLRIRERKLTI